MKRRIGFLKGKPIIEGDSNLKTNNEIIISELSSNNNDVLDTTGFIKLSSLMELGNSSLGIPDVYASSGLKLNFEDENIYSIIEDNKIDKKLDVEIEVLHNTYIPGVYTKDYHNSEHVFDKIIKIKFKRLISTINTGKMYICSAATLCSYIQASEGSDISYVSTASTTTLNEEATILPTKKYILINEDKTKAYWIIYE